MSRINNTDRLYEFKELHAPHSCHRPSIRFLTKLPVVHIEERSKSILLVNSDERSLLSLAGRLMIDGYVVTVASNGIDGLRNLRHNLPDVLILDADVLWGGGEGILDVIRLERLKPQQLVVVTGREENALDRFGIPFALKLTKPVDESMLSNWVRDHIE